MLWYRHDRLSLQLTQEVEKITSKERSLQSKMLDLENELRQRKEEQKQLTRKLNVVSRYIFQFVLADYLAQR